METKTEETKTDQKRRAIRQAAADCFARYGYDKTTLDDIGKVIRLNKASLYYYYKNKEELFIDVVLQESAAFMTDLMTKVATIDDPAEQISTYLTERLRYYKQVLNLHSLSIENLQTLEPQFEQLYTSVLQQELDFLETLMRKAIPPSEDARQLASLLLNVADALKHKAVRDAGFGPTHAIDYSEVEHETRLLTKLILQGVNA
ncbi:transcriptional regulator [Fibrisoma limi BUZ 3]|uniref:Transcriptional regulator n=1 Tax=Fibrisoma limi BUZ 3 TaxID=1185876 RepID=I2GCK5_9BACT|nr:TetR/AcrR family transcriptional regulator [Fibrisoma limi]CCH51629.1 transcriptional regulator [Fibrisoma limi BUZ 3]